VSISESTGLPDSPASYLDAPSQPSFGGAFGGDGGSSNGGSQEHWGGRMPPQDTEAEQSVLGSMLISKDAIADVLEVTKAHDFYKPAHETIYLAITDLYSRGEPADPVTVAAELHRRGELVRIGGAPYLHTLSAAVPFASNADYYAEIVREKAILRRLVDAGTKIAQLGYAGEGQVDDTVDRAQAEIYAITENRTSEDYVPLSDIMEATLDEIEAISSRDGGMNGVPTGFAELDDLTNGLQSGQMVIIAARPAMGKALALDTPLATPRGWTTMGDVQVGDDLYGADGKPTRVVAATDVMLDRPCFEVTFSDGSVLVADAEHQWLTESRAALKSEHAARTGCNRSRNQRTFASVVTTEQIAATLTVGAEARANHAVLNAAPIQSDESHLAIPAYVLGAWLGDGHTSAARLTSENDEIPELIRQFGIVCEETSRMIYSLRLPEDERELGEHPTACPDCGGPYAGGVRCASCHAEHGTLQAQLRALGVLGDKHIPTSYLRAPEADRRALLAGLLDTDGTLVRNGGSVQLALTNERLAMDAWELILSLGYKCTHRTKRVNGRTEASSTAHILTFSTLDDVFWLRGKADLHRQVRPKGLARIGRRYIKSVRRIDSVPVRCVEVDNADHLYLAGRAMIPTHNSTLGLDLCRSASIHNNMTSCIFSLEMTKSEITMRLLSAEARIPLNHLRNGPMSDEDWAKLAPKMSEVSGAPMFIDDSPNLTMMEIRAKARRLKQRHDLKLIVIDYLQLMSSGKKVESRQLEVSEFSRQIKLLAKELEIPIIALSQLNRGPEQRADKRPMMSDLRESGSIEQDADIVMLLHRDDAYEKESTRPGEADIIVAKHRNGPTRDVTVLFQGHYSRFVDMAR
jgi:replicative DNA helicase